MPLHCFLNLPARLPLVICIALLAGCRRPLDVYVVDAGDGHPVAGARVRRMDLKRPYFIIGAIRPRETQVTDAAGLARMKDRRGLRLSINADGYEPRSGSLDHNARSMQVPLQPLQPPAPPPPVE